MAIILRRRKLGLTSCREIAARGMEAYCVVRNDKEVPEGHDLCIRWGCTSNVPIKNVLNKAAAIHEVNDKAGFRKKLDDAELCTETWWNKDAVPREAINDGLIVRPRTHSRGRNLFVVPEMSLDEACRRAGHGYYINRLITKATEYRMFVVSGRVVAVAEKTPGNPNDVAWNVAQGGRFDNVKWDGWPMKAVRKSVEAFNLTDLDFGGVDVMVDKDGEAYVIEINSAPSLTSDYRQTCFAKAFDYIIRNGKARLPMVNEKGGYLKFIHPAVCDRARMV